MSATTALTAIYEVVNLITGGRFVLYQHPDEGTFTALHVHADRSTPTTAAVDEDDVGEYTRGAAAVVADAVPAGDLAILNYATGALHLVLDSATQELQTRPARG